MSRADAESIGWEPSCVGGEPGCVGAEPVRMSVELAEMASMRLNLTEMLEAAIQEHNETIKLRKMETASQFAILTKELMKIKFKIAEKLTPVEYIAVAPVLTHAPVPKFDGRIGARVQIPGGTHNTTTSTERVRFPIAPSRVFQVKATISNLFMPLQEVSLSLLNYSKPVS